MKTRQNKKNIAKKAIVEDIAYALPDDCIVFDTKARKTFVEGVLADIKGYFESKTDGLVEISYEDYSLKNHEFGFKLQASRTSKCKKQMFVNAASAIVNSINYMFRGDNEQYDIAICTEEDKLVVEFVSNW